MYDVRVHVMHDDERGLSMNEEQTARLDDALDVYSEWLTRWFHYDDPEQEGITREKDFYGPYGFRELLFDSGGATFSFYRVMGFEVGYGDDGGNTQLTCFYDETNRLVYVVQTFDLSTQPIYDMVWQDGEYKGKLLHTPKEVNS